MSETANETPEVPFRSRLGRFAVADTILRESKPETLYVVFAGVIPVKTEYDWQTNHLNYVALCEEFEPVGPGEEVPWYAAIISTLEGDITVRKFVRETRPQGGITTVGLGARPPTWDEVRSYMQQAYGQLKGAFEQEQFSSRQAIQDAMRALQNRPLANVPPPPRPNTGNGPLGLGVGVGYAAGAQQPRQLTATELAMQGLMGNKWP